MSKVEPRDRALSGDSAGTSFGAAVMGGLVVAIVGLIAIAAGWVKSSDDGDQGSTLAAAPLPQSAPRQASAEGLTVNQIYREGLPRGRVHPRPVRGSALRRRLTRSAGAAGRRPARVS